MAFYFLFAAGLVILAVRPRLAVRGRFGSPVGNAALIGLLGYATYDLTNLATLRNWTTALALTNLVWGAVLSAVAGRGRLRRGAGGGVSSGSPTQQAGEGDPRPQS